MKFNYLFFIYERMKRKKEWMVIEYFPEDDILDHGITKLVQQRQDRNYDGDE